VIIVDYINTTKILADPFTKRLSCVVIDGASREMGLRLTWVAQLLKPVLCDQKFCQLGKGKTSCWSNKRQYIYVFHFPLRWLLLVLHGRLTFVLMCSKAKTLRQDTVLHSILIRTHLCEFGCKIALHEIWVISLMDYGDDRNVPNLRYWSRWPSISNALRWISLAQD
jgi:hypothetical protein